MERRQPPLTSSSLEFKQKAELIGTLIKPWMMGIEYVIVVFTLVTIIDLFFIIGLTPMMINILLFFGVSLLYILFINTVWAYLYNRKKPGNLSLKAIIIDSFYLTRFLVVLSQIYPQSAIRHFKNQNMWDKTKRQINKL